MKYLILICLLTLSFTSCTELKPVKIISTGEKTYINEYTGLYKTNDTITIYQNMNTNGWRLNENWSTKKDTIIYMTTYKVAILTK